MLYNAEPLLQCNYTSLEHYLQYGKLKQAIAQTVFNIQCLQLLIELSRRVVSEIILWSILLDWGGNKYYRTDTAYSYVH